jgi:uncharacterized membrane protein
MDVITVFLDGMRIILGFFLLLFVPGFAISLVFYPRPTDIGLIERLVYSTVLSIGSVIVLVLFMDVVLGMNTTPRNISIIICAFSVFALIVWQCEKKYGNSTLKLKLDSLLSKDYHTLPSYINNLKNYIGDCIGLIKRIIYKKDL